MYVISKCTWLNDVLLVIASIISYRVMEKRMPDYKCNDKGVVVFQNENNPDCDMYYLKG